MIVSHRLSEIRGSRRNPIRFRIRFSLMISERNQKEESNVPKSEKLNLRSATIRIGFQNLSSIPKFK
ncbi:hypothetical protein CH370_03320 [Leptospira kmetyi]|uniref:Uncharacterized protein n=1 Tax=Leptospira kmetyi TaxID=408139 RepID=A0ABX4NCT7_9LEPT|nr:hypothetical protein CH378_04350 [Leptospira kmetyi]PJZ43464.1 hypothetical protein CH370_03320 [Leptospira kmetyi]